MRQTLASLVRPFGIQTSYRAASGETVRASEDAIRAVLGTLGVAAAGDLESVFAQEQERVWSRPVEPVVLAWNSRLRPVTLRLSPNAARRAIHYELQLEHGHVVGGKIGERTTIREYGRRARRRVEIAVDIEMPVPFGYHELHVQTADGAANTFVISAPRRCHSGDRPREWGVFAPLYSIREQPDQAIGEIGDLESLMQWIAAVNGDFVATLPISAAFLRHPFDPSPYSPASRLFWNEVYLSLAPEPTVAAPDPLVDYRATSEAKRALLEPMAARFFASNGGQSVAFREFLSLYPDAKDYAAFRAAGEHFRAGWPAWPARTQNGKLRTADYGRAAADYHLFAQFEAHGQLTALADNARATGVRLYLDMPLGVHPDSYDIWRNRNLFITGAAAGAPPDPFFTNGQNWGFPPPQPRQLRDQRYDYWRRVLQTQLRYAGVLRLDHVMALHRLYVIPSGAPATQGVYVRYPEAELYAVLALESHRAEAAIVGEDLGTVPAEVRKSMARHGVKRMFVVQFEASDHADAPIGAVPASAVVSLNTHDMPPFRTYWEGRDADLRRELGLLDERGVREVKQSRRRIAEALSRMLGAANVLETRAAHDRLVQFLARSPADMLLLNLEDAWLETEPQNVPGTSQERPNWRRRLKLTLPELKADPNVRRLLAMVERARRLANEEPDAN